MNSNKKPISPETRGTLYEEMGETIQFLHAGLKDNFIYKERLVVDEKNKASVIFNAFLALEIYMQYINIEVLSTLRASFRAKLPAEQRYNLKFINCVIIEGYKYMYGYKGGRQKSLWIKKIKPLVSIIGCQEFENDFNRVTSLLVEFGRSNVTDKEKRDLSFHSDLETLLVYEMLINISEEEEAQRVISFQKLLKELRDFTAKYIEMYMTSLELYPGSLSKNELPCFDYDFFKNNKDSTYAELGIAIEKHAKRLDDFTLQQQKYKSLAQQFKDFDVDSIALINKVIEISMAYMQLMLIYIDLASAIRAFIIAEHTIEKQLSLKYVNTIIYEGFNKIYGIDDNACSSFWEMYIRPLMLENEEITITNEFNRLDIELLAIRKEVLSTGSQRQVSVHLDKGITKVYSMLQNLNPSLEILKALRLLDIMPKVLNLFEKCLHIIDSKSLANHEKKMSSTYDKVDSLLSFLQKIPDSEKKANAVGILEKFKSGDLLNELIRESAKK